MRSLYIIPLLVFLLNGAAWAQEPARSLSLPPESMAQWYPPVNKRQEWLHTMFGLRRAMQAVGEYNALGEYKLAAQWAERFAQSYKRLARMVPEWQDEIEGAQADRLVAAAAAGDGDGVNSALRRLGTTCRSCHNENRAMVTLIYRTSDYNDFMVESSDTMEEVPYPKAMARLGTLMNRIKIAQEDGRHAVAREAGAAFIAATKDLADSCGACHKDAAPRERIFGTEIRQALKTLGEELRQNNRKGTDEAIGTIGAFACGRCHGIHKNTAELRRSLLPRD
jgi:cytochrome c556